jgi:hypothetical protein
VKRLLHEALEVRETVLATGHEQASLEAAGAQPALRRLVKPGCATGQW